MIDLGKLETAMGDLEEDIVKEILKEVMADGGTDAQKALEACQRGMDIIGSHFENGDYYIGDLIFAGDLMTESIEILSPALIKETGEGLGKILLCTVEGDMHDIGKNIVKAVLTAAGFEIVDLGINVKPELIAETTKAEDIKIIALSGVLTVAVNSMKSTVQAIKDAGLRDSVHVLIGGNPVNQSVCEIVGADAWTINPQTAINICRQWATA